MKRMQTAETETSIDSASLKPWHMKVSFTMGEQSAHPGEKGTIEEWWGGPTQYRVVYASPTISVTEIHSANEYFRTAGASTTPYLLKLVQQQTVHPLPKGGLLGDSELVSVNKKVGNVEIDCVSIQGAKKISRKPQPFVSPTYCFEKNTTSLLGSYDFGVLVVQRERVGGFQGRQVPTRTTVSLGGVKAISANIETLEARSLTMAEVGSLAEVEKAAEIITPVDKRLANEADETATKGAQASQGLPTYPASAKAAHETGVVLIRVIIGKDGQVRETDLIYAPYKDLGIAALEAVRKWRYKPYLLNDQPTEIDTTVQVNFRIGD